MAFAEKTYLLTWEAGEDGKRAEKTVLFANSTDGKLCGVIRLLNILIGNDWINFQSVA